MTSTAARGLYSSQAYAPFGESFATAGASGATTSAVDPDFTGQNSDTAPSLYDFTFREDSMSQGRWISPDPSGVAAVDPTTPQTWNRYAYVAGNPLISIDPLGLNLYGGCDLADPCANGAGGGIGGGGISGPSDDGCFEDASDNCTNLYDLQNPYYPAGGAPPPLESNPIMFGMSVLNSALQQYWNEGPGAAASNYFAQSSGGSPGCYALAQGGCAPNQVQYTFSQSSYQLYEFDIGNANLALLTQLSLSPNPTSNPTQMHCSAQVVKVGKSTIPIIQCS